MTRQTHVRNARPARLVAALMLVAACSADPSTSVAPNLAVEPPTGYPIGSDGNCLPDLTDDLSRVCWLTQYTAGTKAPDPMSAGDTECTCAGANKR